MKRIMLAGLMTCVSGCAQLQVRVELLSQDYLSSAAHADAIRETARIILSGDRTEADRFIEEAKAQYASIRTQCADAYQAQVNSLPVSPPASSLAALKEIADAISKEAKQPSAQVDVFFQMRSNNLKAADEAAQKILRQEQGTLGLFVRPDATRSPEELSGKAVAAVIERNSSYLRVRDEIGIQFLAAVNNCKSGVESFVAKDLPSIQDIGRAKLAIGAAADRAGEKATDAVANAADRTIRGDARALLDRAEAYHVANAPKKAWSKAFNIARGEGQGGGVDIGIKMTGTGDFSVKGFTFDARSTSDMVRKVAVQSVALVASAYGAPITVEPPKASPATPASTGFDPARNISEDQLKLEESRQAALAYETALLNVSNEILSNMPALTAGQSEALAKLRTVITINKDIAMLSPKAPE